MLFKTKVRNFLNFQCVAVYAAVLRPCTAFYRSKAIIAYVPAEQGRLCYGLKLLFS